MNTQKLGMLTTAQGSDDHLIPTPPLIPLSLIEQLAASHAAILNKWKVNFGLDLRPPKVA